MNARTAFHVTRRLAPMLGRLGPMLRASADRDSLDLILTPIAQAIAEMSDADCDYVLDACLDVATRRVAETERYVPVARGRKMQFDDIDMPQMLQIAARVLQDSLGPFFAGLPSTSAVAGLSLSPTPE